MTDERLQYQRRSPRNSVTSRVRLRGHDYSAPGTYFLTSVTQERACLFGSVRDSVMLPTDAGNMIAEIWSEIGIRFPQVRLNAMVVMPNHIHGLILIPGMDVVECHPDLPTDSTLMHWFKSRTTHEYANGVRELGWPRFAGHLWQPGFIDHIVRDDAAFDRIRNYIEANPSRWPHDDENPVK